MTFKSKTLAVPALVLLTLGLSSAAFADPYYDAAHPRKAEVNDRLATQNARIHQAVRNGTMSRAEARDLHAQDRSIHREEHAMSRANGGAITPGEQASLNQQENAVSGQIGGR